MNDESSTDIVLKVNSEHTALRVRNNWTLLKMLREVLGLKGTKRGCDTGDCGACTVIINGKACPSCLILAPDLDGQEVTTIESVGSEELLDPIQELFIAEGAYQCGFCIPGIIMSTKALLTEKPNATLGDVKRALSGHLCRCGTYTRILNAFSRRDSSES
jgi:carbon-monoxide dehydrogenase small subunit